MKEVFILSDYTQFFKELTKQLEFTENENRIISLPSFENESDWHDWTTQLFKNNTISKLVIPISIPTDNPINTEGLKMALHIRLNYELPLLQRLTPIILLSDFSIKNIIVKNTFDTDNNPQNLLFTKGVYLSSFDSEEIIKTVKNAEPCPLKDYQKQVLNKIKILPKASIGKHSITNAWGCFKLAQVTGLRDEIFKHNAISEHLKTLYSKYLICYNDAYTQEKRIDLNPIKCNSKKILFIDDQADEGWEDLMKNIFKGARNNFVCINSAKYKNSETKLFHDSEGFLTECRSHIGKDWDLIIIDLRLNPEIEDIDNEMIPPTEFSGYKLIDEFLNENEGCQIIVSTASNKIWNINAALKRGASSYYVKESPEFNYSVNETNKHYENFKSDVHKCFKRCYLRDIYKIWKSAVEENKNQKDKFIQESNSMLDIAWSLVKQELLDFGYLTLFQIIELYANQEYDHKDNSIKLEGKKCYMIKTLRKNETWKLTFNKDSINGDYFSTGEEQKTGQVRPTNLYKASCLLKFKYKKDDNFLKLFGNLNDLRNKIAHEGSKRKASSENIKKVLEIIKMIRQ